MTQNFSGKISCLHEAAAAEAAGADVSAAVGALLAAGADPHQTDENGNTAFNIAAPSSPVAGRLMTLHWLSGKSPKGLNDRSGSHGSTLAQYIAKWLHDDEIEGHVKTAMVRGMKTDVPNASGWTPLTAAAAMGRVKAVEIFAGLYSRAALAVKTTESYSANGVTYKAGLDAAGVAKARLEQDKNLSAEMKNNLLKCVEILADS